MLLERYFVSFLFVLSAMFLIMSFNIPFYARNIGALGAGFFPRIISVLLVVLIGLYFIQLIKEKAEKQGEKPNKRIIAQQISLMILLIASIASTNIIGMLPSLGVFMFIALTFIQKIHWRRSLFFTIVVLLIMYGIFELWIKGALPKGLFG